MGGHRKFMEIRLLYYLDYHDADHDDEDRNHGFKSIINYRISLNVSRIFGKRKSYEEEYPSHIKT